MLFIYRYRKNSANNEELNLTISRRLEPQPDVLNLQAHSLFVPTQSETATMLHKEVLDTPIEVRISSNSKTLKPTLEHFKKLTQQIADNAKQYEKTN